MVFSAGKLGFGDGFDVFDGVEGVGVDAVDVVDDLWEVFSSDDGHDDFDGAIVAFGVDGGDTVLFGSEAVDELGGVVFAGDADHDHADADFFFEGDADEVAGGEASGVGEGAGDVVEVGHDLADGEEPDVDFDEADEGGDVSEAVGDGDDADGAKGNVGEAGEENQDGEEDPFEEVGVVEADEIDWTSPLVSG